MIRLLYFSWVRERIGQADEQVELPVRVSTVASLLDWLATRSAGHGAALDDRSRIRVAVNQSFVGPEARLCDGDEVAIFPPVTGG